MCFNRSSLPCICTSSQVKEQQRNLQVYTQHFQRRYEEQTAEGYICLTQHGGPSATPPPGMQSSPDDLQWQWHSSTSLPLQEEYDAGSSATVSSEEEYDDGTSASLSSQEEYDGSSSAPAQGHQYDHDRWMKERIAIEALFEIAEQPFPAELSTSMRPNPYLIQETEESKSTRSHIETNDVLQHPISALRDTLFESTNSAGLVDTTPCGHKPHHLPQSFREIYHQDK